MLNYVRLHLPSWLVIRDDRLKIGKVPYKDHSIKFWLQIASIVPDKKKLRQFPHKILLAVVSWDVNTILLKDHSTNFGCYWFCSFKTRIFKGNFNFQ